MINISTTVRRANAQDHYQLANLLFHESHTHRHLDWRSALDWLGTQNFWVLEEHGFIIAAFACPEDPPNIAWIRLFTHHPHLDVADTWSALWSVAQPEISLNNPKTQISTIILKPWFQNILLQSGFEQKQNIVLLKLQVNHIKTRITPNTKIRRMTEADLHNIADIDAQAFGDFWKNTFDSLRLAYLQSFHATVAEDESGKVVAYQISTGSRFGAHLARLGVHPEAQNRGIASALVNELIQTLSMKHHGTLSVNTQDDNLASMSLYKKIGFIQTGEQLPVLVKHVS
ncbi:MAG: putative acetyltransferase [Chloroflexi bacterium OLB14]|nr:MAG: putative acetyltransferase [Chloroflexi bacterium OLB14]